MTTEAPSTRGTGLSARRLALGYSAVFLLALGVRGLYLLEMASSPLLSVLVGDGRQYHAWASAIAGGDWLGGEAFYQAPLYPYAMAVLVRLFGPGLWPIRLVQMLLGSMSCVLLAHAGRRSFSYPIGLIAGAMLALYPPAIFFDGLVQKTSFSLFFTTALLALVSELHEPGRRAPGLFLMGIVLGALALTRENALILVPVLGAWLWTRDAGVSRRLRSVGWCGLGLALMLVPVAARNLAVAGEFLPTTSQLGTNFFIGNNADADGRYRPLQSGREDARVERDDALALAEHDLGRSLSAGEVSRYWLDRSWSYIKSDPRGWARLLWRKTSLLLNTHEIADSESIEAYREDSTILRVGAFFHWGFLGPLAFVGLWATRSRWRPLWIFYAIALSLAASLVLFYVMARYRAPLIPIAALFAAAGVDALTGRIMSGSGKRVAAYLALAVIAWTVQNRPLPVETYPRATTHYNVGVSLYENGQLEDAREAFERTLRITPHFAEAHFNLANVLRSLGRPTEAMSHYRSALALEPALANAGVLVAVAHLLSQMDQLAEAKAYLERVLTIDPDHAMAHDLLANILAHEGRRAEAIEHYRAALATDPGLTDAHFKLGLLFSELGDLDAALVHLKETTRLAPNFTDGHLVLADVAARARKRRRAPSEKPS